jgi:metal-responsive CopG/Arc/MetJ family transcriptional regulator
VGVVMGGMVRTHVVMPKEVVDEIDELVGPRRRSEFLTELAQKELRRRRLLEAFDRAAGSLAEVEIPGWETSESAEEWVRNLRREGTRDDWANAAKAELP